MSFNTRLKAMRIDAGMTQKELADIARTSQQNIARYEAGGVDMPRRAVLERIASALDVSPSWLAYGRDDMDELNQEAIDIAKNFMKMDNGHKAAIRQIVAIWAEKNRKQ